MWMQQRNNVIRLAGGSQQKPIHFNFDGFNTIIILFKNVLDLGIVINQTKIEGQHMASRKEKE